MNESGRTGKSLKNMIYAIASQILMTVISFITRSVFVHTLSSEYLGINGLFGNILSILALAEMGIGSAIVYSLYKPLAENNQSKIVSLMQLYKKTYTIIGLFILVVGCSLTPFLDVFVSEMPSIPYIRLIYVLYVINNASTYFFSYKAMLINADQKQYITTRINLISSFFMHLAEILVLIFTHNFILYLVTMIVFTVGKNVYISCRANKQYPFIKKSKGEPLPKEEKTNIVNNVKAMLMHRIGGVIVDGTDNILISKMVNVIVVGLYSNYYLITHTLHTVFTLLFNALTASVGNLGALETKEKIYLNFRTIDFATSWLYGFSFICLFNLFNPFITLWIGAEYTFALPMVFVISLNFYLTGMRNSVLTFRTALGLFWHDRYKAVIEAVAHLILAIIFGKLWGAIGIFISTATTTVAVCLVVEPYIVFKYGFGEKARTYYIGYFKNLVLSLSLAFSLKAIGLLFSFGAALTLLINGALCLVVPNFVYWILYRKTEEYKKLFGIVKGKVFNHRGEKGKLL